MMLGWSRIFRFLTREPILYARVFASLLWQVNLALVLDGSATINALNEEGWDLEKGFAVDTVAAFAARNLFDNGG
ncbi:unnamed protein product, partial [Laminaria digitata]